MSLLWDLFFQRRGLAMVHVLHVCLINFNVTYLPKNKWGHGTHLWPLYKLSKGGGGQER